MQTLTPEDLAILHLRAAVLVRFDTGAAFRAVYERLVREAKEEAR